MIHNSTESGSEWRHRIIQNHEESCPYSRLGRENDPGVDPGAVESYPKVAPEVSKSLKSAPGKCQADPKSIRNGSGSRPRISEILEEFHSYWRVGGKSHLAVGPVASKSTKS